MNQPAPRNNYGESRVARRARINAPVDAPLRPSINFSDYFPAFCRDAKAIERPTRSPGKGTNLELAQRRYPIVDTRESLAVSRS